METGDLGELLIKGGFDEISDRADSQWPQFLYSA